MHRNTTAFDDSMKDDMLFLGCFYPECEYESICENTSGGIQNASNLLQWDYILGLEHNLGHAIRTATRMSLGIYPRHYRKAWIKTHLFERSGGAFGTVIGFWNSVPVRPFFFNKVGTGHVMTWAKQCGGKGVLFAYSYAMAPIITATKKRFPDIRTVLILPDLPRYTFMEHKTSLLYRIRRGMDERALQEALEHTDLLVTITKQMGDILDPQNRIGKMTVDGMIRDRVPDESGKSNDHSEFTIAYTGTLTKDYGILDLLSAAGDLNGRAFRLIICGKGEAEPEVRAAAAGDPKIQYKGLVSSDEARLIQQNADLLINPRQDDHEYTKYSFPSKILQYMSTGTPVLCYRLSGFGEEYDSHLFYVEDGETLSSAIRRVMDMNPDARVAKGRDAAEFVGTHKNNIAQTKRILEQLYDSYPDLLRHP